MRNTNQKRKGTATAELAVCLPLILLLIFGGIEAANGIFLKQGLTVSAYEAAKMATTVGYTVAEAEARGVQILTARGFDGATIAINPNTTQLFPGTPVTVTVTAPANLNAISPSISFGAGTTIRASITMNRN